MADSSPASPATDGFMKDGKVVILFKSAGDAPPLKIKKFKLQAKANFQTVSDFLRKQLRFKPTDPLFLFINCAFQPNPEEIVSDLFKCFQSDGKLVVNYCSTMAWG